MSIAFETYLITYIPNNMDQTSYKNNYSDVISIPQAKLLFGRGCSYNNELYLIDNISARQLPQNGKETECIVIIFCERGKIKYDTKGETIIAEENDILFLTNGQWVSKYKVMSADYQGQAILIDTQTMNDIDSETYPKKNLLHKLRHTNKIRLNSKEMRNCNNLFAIIYDQLTGNSNLENFSLAKLFTKGVIQLVLNKETQSIDERIEQDERIYVAFSQLVDEKKMLNIHVAEYCHELHISKSYLNQIVHKFAGTTPLKYINKKRTYYICILVINTSAQSMPISKIAEFTHFRSPSELSRFIKRELNMSLSKFRHLTPDERLHIIQYTTLDQTSLRADLPKTYIQEGSILPLS